MQDTLAAERHFYSQYEWCLNPALSVQDLLVRFTEEMSRHESLTGWQRDESKANLYLFVCAIACTADDYFAGRWLNLTPIANRYPQFQACTKAAQSLLDVTRLTARIFNAQAWGWRRGWDDCIRHLCALLLSDSSKQAECFAKLRDSSARLVEARLPAALLKHKMRLPEAFRNQDMAHQDVVTLIRRYYESSAAADQPTVVVGLRTAGAYFAPLMAEYLRARQSAEVSWFSIRPKQGLAPWEATRLRKAAKERTRVLLVDDYPATGHTMKITLALLAKFGIRPEQTVVLAPTHPAQPHWVQAAGIEKRTPVFTITAADLHKNAMLAPGEAERLCRSYFADAGWAEARVVHDDEVEETNGRLVEHAKDGHHVREKRVFALELSGPQGTRRQKLFFKSVGWGWLGYHAYLAGTRLEGFVPRVLGLRNGLLVAEWIDDASPMPEHEANAETIDIIASYVAARFRALRLTGDCCLESRTYRWTGADDILRILRAAYGRYFDRLKTPALRKELFKYIASVPTLVDGKMLRDEWIKTPHGLFKGDFEHHNFGGADPDIVDPAYDLAAAILEFGSSEEAEQDLIRIYREKSGDTSIDDRILLHKILYGSTVMKHAIGHAARGKLPEKNNVRYHEARNFLIYSMNRFCAGILGAAPPGRWTNSVFFLDLDGVFDRELLGFPHTTQSALLALALLRAHGFSIVLNTGRSVQHVRQYCKAYGFEGAVAEFGSVFVDAVRGKELPLLDHSTLDQLRRCRDAIKNIPGVYIDPSYEFSIRAYRYDGRFVGLASEELQRLLSNPEFSDLKYICRNQDSYIVQKSATKGRAVEFVREQVGDSSTRITAIGDSVYDIEMLKVAHFAYAPANCSNAVRTLAKEGHCRIMKEPFQNGLLAAVRHRVRLENKSAQPLPLTITPLNNLMQTLLKVPDRQTVLQTLALLAWWNL